MNLVFAADRTYGVPLAVTIYSLLNAIRAPRSVHVYVLTADDIGDLPSKIDSVTRLIAHGVSVQWIAVDPNVLSRFKPSECAPHISTSAYLRLFLPRLLPATVKRALYLDCDLLVLDDIGGLYDFDLRGKTVGATTDNWKTVGEAKLPDYRNMGFRGDEPYFNSGVMLIDMERFRAGRYADRALDYVKTSDWQLPYCDQDALNAVLRDEWHDFGNRWNVHCSMWVDGTVLITHNSDKQPLIVHFAGPQKPWECECQNAYTDVWRQMREDLRGAI